MQLLGVVLSERRMIPAVVVARGEGRFEAEGEIQGRRRMMTRSVAAGGAGGVASSRRRLSFANRRFASRPSTALLRFQIPPPSTIRILGLEAFWIWCLRSKWGSPAGSGICEGGRIWNSGRGIGTGFEEDGGRG